MANQPVDKALVRQLVDGTIAQDNAERLLKMERKDAERFETYIAVLQETVPWKDRILMRLNDRLFVTLNDRNQRVVKSSCGQDFGDYRQNWKLQCRVRVRKTLDEMR
jgi:acetone carboxylase gamma subunit